MSFQRLAPAAIPMSFSSSAGRRANRLDPTLPQDPDDPLQRAWLACERALGTTIAAAKMAA